MTDHDTLEATGRYRRKKTTINHCRWLHVYWKGEFTALIFPEPLQIRESNSLYTATWEIQPQQIRQHAAIEWFEHWSKGPRQSPH